MHKITTLIHYKYLNKNSPKLLCWYLKILEKSGLIDSSNKAKLSVIATRDHLKQLQINYNICDIFKFKEDIGISFEEDTISLIPSLIESVNSDYIAYIHIKGSSKSKITKNSLHWGSTMIRNLGHIAKLLKRGTYAEYDTFGSFLTYSSFGQKLECLVGHYPGNFWIARSIYLQNLDFSLASSRDRFSSEYILGSRMGNMYNIESYKGDMYNYQSNYIQRKFIKYIYERLMNDKELTVSGAYENFYIGSELKISTPGFPHFISPPSWVSKIQRKDK